MELLGYVLTVLLSPPHLRPLTKSQAYARYVRLGLGMSFFLGEQRLSS